MIELTDYTIAPEWAGEGLRGLHFSLARGDLCAIQTDSRDDGRLFLSAVATLRSPVSGAYYFMGKTLDFSDYRSLLPYKKRIGYIAWDAAMISNMTIRENLLLMRSYYENSLRLPLDERTTALCRSFGIEGILNLRPGAASPTLLRLAIAARELAKCPDMLLLEYPEDYIGHTSLPVFMEALENMPVSEMGIAFLSENRAFIEAFSNRSVPISSGTQTEETG